MTNKLQNTRIEFHILQSFPVSCLNRDDVGSPKSAMIGGTQRARVSSQCWKRAIRLKMHEYGIETGKRTCYAARMIISACKAKNIPEEQAEKWAENFIKEISSIDTKSKSEIKSSALLFLSNKEAESIVDYYIKSSSTDEPAENEDTNKKGKKSEKEKKEKKETLKDALTKKGIIDIHDGLDIALFGRMAASANYMNVEAAASVAHAISTHKVVSEVEFFTAVDDMKADNDQQGSGHMGALEFNSATYYRYISLDLGQLLTNLGGDPELDLTDAIDAFTKALFMAVPSARQNTMTASTIWDYAKVLIRKGQRIQASFEEAVKPQNGQSIVAASKAKLKEELNRIKDLSGKLYGRDGIDYAFEFGEITNYSIDDLVNDLCAKVRELQAQ